jgi:arabinosaccharide transport system substrate-binding protein
MSFPLGKPILVMLLVTVIAGGAQVLRAKPRPRADLVLWVFADAHAQTYAKDVGSTPSVLRQFTANTGKTVQLELIGHRGLNVRLGSLYMADASGPHLPDLVELEIGTVSRYFRPPLDEVGLLPLNDLLKQSGWLDRLVRSRVVTWSKQGTIFGVPHDVSPVALCYRADLFAEAGVDIESSRTWQEFQDNCLKAQAHWRQQGHRRRWALELFEASSGYLGCLLLQRGINLLDADDRPQLDDRRVAATVAAYALMLAGPRRIAADGAAGDAVYAQDMATGTLCAWLAPDWRVASMKQYAPQLAGKVRLMPLPRFEPRDAPTSTYGGTMLGISRRCADPQGAWRLVEHLYLSRAGLEARQHHSDMLPPVIDAWDDPVYHRADPYFAGRAPGETGQRIGELYVQLARQIPVRIVSPAAPLAEPSLTFVMGRALAHARRYGEAGLEEACRQWLADETRSLRRRIQQGKFE